MVVRRARGGGELGQRRMAIPPRRKWMVEREKGVTGEEEWRDQRQQQPFLSSFFKNVECGYLTFNPINTTTHYFVSPV